MGQDTKERRCLQGIIGPAFTGCSPELQEVAQPGSDREGKDGQAMISGGKYKEGDQQEGKDSQGLVKGRGHKGEHETKEGGKDEPIGSFMDPAQAAVRDFQASPLSPGLGNAVV